MIQHQTCEPLFLEVPHDTLGQTRRRGGDLTGQASGNVVAGEHHLVDSGVGVGLVGFKPHQFLDRIRGADSMPDDRVECFGSDFGGKMVGLLDRTLVAVDHRRSQRRPVCGYREASHHLSAECYTRYVAWGDIRQQRL